MGARQACAGGRTARPLHGRRRGRGAWRQADRPAGTRRPAGTAAGNAPGHAGRLLRGRRLPGRRLLGRRRLEFPNARLERRRIVGLGLLNRRADDRAELVAINGGGGHLMLAIVAGRRRRIVIGADMREGDKLGHLLDIDPAGEWNSRH